MCVFAIDVRSRFRFLVRVSRFILFFFPNWTWLFGLLWIALKMEGFAKKILIELDKLNFFIRLLILWTRVQIFSIDLPSHLCSLFQCSIKFDFSLTWLGLVLIWIIWLESEPVRVRNAFLSSSFYLFFYQIPFRCIRKKKHAFEMKKKTKNKKKKPKRRRRRSRGGCLSGPAGPVCY